jgi:hypothetical protein
MCSLVDKPTILSHRGTWLSFPFIVFSLGMGWTWVNLVRRPLFGPGWWMMMTVELLEGGNLPQCLLSTTNHTWSDLGSNPGPWQWQSNDLPPEAWHDFTQKLVYRHFQPELSVSGDFPASGVAVLDHSSPTVSATCLCCVFKRLPRFIVPSLSLSLCLLNCYITSSFCRNWDLTFIPLR